MKKSFLLLLLSPLFLFAQKSYQYSISLDNVNYDQIHVTLIPPAIESKELKFSFPKIVPGTYSISDYGRFIEHFVAYDINGNKIETQTSGPNAWAIDNTKGVSRIEYDMNDSYDSKLDNPIFEPAGSDIEKDSSLYPQPTLLIRVLPKPNGSAYSIDRATLGKVLWKHITC
jgi:hypothetical protein